jgi:glycosyltransferase involved in cell wall biosynthesis
MRIAHVTATFPPYMAGTGNVCYHNALELARLGHQVSVFTANYPLKEWIDSSEFIVHRLPAVLRFGNAPLLPGLMKIKNVDLIHLHYPFIFGAELIWMVSKLRQIPYVVTYHNDLIGRGIRRILFDTYLPISAGIVMGGASKTAVVSLEHARSCRMASFFKKHWKDVVEIPNGVDLGLFRPSRKGLTLRQRYGIAEDNKIILFVGALDQAHYFKGVNYLLEAFTKIITDKKYLIIVGEGELKNQYKRHAVDCGVQKQTFFPENVTDAELPDYYNSADLIVLPSIALESFGLVLIEAMACEKPVIASDLPGVRSVVADTKDGLLVPPSNVNALSEKIQYLLENPSIRHEMGNTGRAKVEAKYAWPKIVPRLIQMYEEVLGARHSSDPKGEKPNTGVS